MIQYFRSLFAWRTLQVRGGYLYQINKVSGDRRARWLGEAGHPPADLDWLLAASGRSWIIGCRGRLMVRSGRAEMRGGRYGR